MRCFYINIEYTHMPRSRKGLKELEQFLASNESLRHFAPKNSIQYQPTNDEKKVRIVR